jgi:hypothetical protein
VAVAIVEAVVAAVMTAVAAVAAADEAGVDAVAAVAVAAAAGSQFGLNLSYCGGLGDRAASSPEQHSICRLKEGDAPSLRGCAARQ